MEPDQYRTVLKSIYLTAINAVQGASCVSRFLLENPIHGDIHLIAIGKASQSMLEGVLAIDSINIIDGLVISHQEILKKQSNIVYFTGGHPIPDEKSLEAGRLLLQYIRQVPDNACILFLISGGCSALVEVIQPPLKLQNLRELNQWLLSSGLPIAQMNQIRSQYSSIKRGKLHSWLGDQKTICLMISDVESDDVVTIGSGLLFSREVDDGQALPISMPQSLQEQVKLARLKNKQFENSNRPTSWAVIANNYAALLAAQQFAQTNKIKARLHNKYIKGEAVEQGGRLAHYILEHPDILHIWGGEPTVVLPDNPGQGGRCQMLALSAAKVLAGRQKAWLLAAGTDGKDGDSDYAGAIVDNTSVFRDIDKGDVEANNRKLPKSDQTKVDRYIAQANASEFLALTGDALPATNTGTNVADIILGFSSSEN